MNSITNYSKFTNKFYLKHQQTNLINLIDSEPETFKMFTDQSLGFKGNFPHIDDRVTKLRSIISYFEKDPI